MGGEAAAALLKQIIADEREKPESPDTGCICEIDLSQSAQIRTIMNSLHSRLTVKRQSKVSLSSDEERKEPSAQGV